MKIEKEKRLVSIICQDGSMVKGFVHINPGERVIDFLDDPKEVFIAVTNAEFSNIKEVHSFRVYSAMTKRKSLVLLNKATIKLVEEI